MSDQLVAKASTYTQHNIERRGQTYMPQAEFEPTILESKRLRRTPQTAKPLGPAQQHTVRIPGENPC
jgi:hypothetical protein